MANGMLAQQMVWSIKVQIEILHKGQHSRVGIYYSTHYTPPFAVKSSSLPFTICDLLFAILDNHSEIGCTPQPSFESQ